MTTAHDILRYKGRPFTPSTATDTVLAALGVMAEHDIGAVLVLDGDQIAGLLTERDYARKVAARRAVVEGLARRRDHDGRRRLRVGEPLGRGCMTFMTERRVRHLPVVDNGRVVGVVSIGDLVKATIDEQEFTINQLKNYIAG